MQSITYPFTVLSNLLLVKSITKYKTFCSLPILASIIACHLLSCPSSSSQHLLSLQSPYSCPLLTWLTTFASSLPTQFSLLSLVLQPFLTHPILPLPSRMLSNTFCLPTNNSLTNYSLPSSTSTIFFSCHSS